MNRTCSLLTLGCWLLAFWSGCATRPADPGTASSRAMSATEVYRLIGPSMAFVRTPSGSGSGALTDDGYVLTNAHVVWPYPAVGITFPGGTVLEEVPVAFLDLIGDIALLGPIRPPVEPLRFTPREDAEVGSDVYLIGYPLETETVPRPAIAGGILSRVREWEQAGITFFQTDASVAGGQSGGVLATDRGEVIGVSGLAASDGPFAFVASAEDVMERVRRMRAGGDVDGLGSRGFRTAKAATRHEFTLDNRWTTAAFAATPAENTTFDLNARTARGEGELTMYLLDDWGDTVDSADEHGDRASREIHAAVDPGLHYVLVCSESEDGFDVALDSSIPLARIADPDDGQRLAVGSSCSGSLDFPYDLDWFRVDLAAGQRITVTVESVMIDAFVEIDRPGAPASVEDDDGGGGILGLNAQLVFEAAEAGEHFVVVSDATGYDMGGYLLDVRPAAAGEQARRFGEEEPEAGAASSSAPPPEQARDPEGEREWLKYFAFLPDGWTVDSEFFRRIPGASGSLLVGAGRFTGLGYDPSAIVMRVPAPRGTSATATVDETVRQLRDQFAGFRVVSRQSVTVDSALGERLEVSGSAAGTDLKIVQIHVIRDNRLWMIQCAHSAGNADAERCSQLLQSFRFPGDEPADRPRLETAMVVGGLAQRVTDLHEAGEQAKAAEQLDLLTRFAESIGEGDPGYAETMQTVGHLNTMLGRYDRAISFLERAVSTLSSKGQPERLASALNNLAWAHYLAGSYAEGEPLARRAVDIDSATRGSEHSSTSAASHTLAMLLVGLERYEEAEPLLRGVLAFAERTQGANDEITAGYITDLCTLLRRMGRNAEAGELAARLSEIDTPPPDWATVGGRLPAERPK